MTRILVFYPSNKRSIALETEILEIHRRGIEIELLTTCEAGDLHAFLADEGVPTHTHPLSTRLSLVYYLRQIAYLARFCRQRGFTTVFSNLQHANFIAVFAQYLCSANFVIFRHHVPIARSDEDIPFEPNRMERIFDRVINRLARKTAVVSSGVYEGMRFIEKADMSRVVVLPLIYDFDQYGQPDPDAVRSIRSRYPARLTLLISGRMIPLKRHLVAFSAVRELVDDGLDVRMFVLDDGPERPRLEAFIQAHHLEDRIIMLGFRTDFLDYMAASDLLIHPSLSESTSHVIKEMGLLGKTVIACSGAGLEDYLEDGRNAFLVPRSTGGSEIAQVLRGVYGEPERLAVLGEALRETVLEQFGVKPESVDRYIALAETVS